MIELNETYWQTRWENKQTGWDIGYPSTPLKEYIDQLEDTALSILIPGCGNAYEGGYLVEKGFENTFLLDISKSALTHVEKRFPGIPENNLIHDNFFNHQGEYDLILEQTFFCALDPAMRPKYVQKIRSLLKPGGKLVGVLFHDRLYQDHPPFGGFLPEYKALFSPHFHVHVMEMCYNSIKPRKDREVFILLEKPRS